jgi:hypothetical protein
MQDPAHEMRLRNADKALTSGATLAVQTVHETGPLVIMQSNNSSPTDREILVAIFNAIGALAERRTGERLVVHTERENSEGSDVYSSPASATFLAKEEASIAFVPAQKDGPMHN